MTAAIEAAELSKRYGPRVAVDRVTFQVTAGEIMGLLGPNGSGKTTILRILTGYLRPSSGRARVAGFDVVEDSLAARARVGYVPENAPLYDGLRVRELLDMMARIKGLAGPAVGQAVRAVCEQLELTRVRELVVGKLSRGFRQRVAIAQALLNRPEVLVLDEPGNGLDPQQIIELRGLIRSLAGQHTVLVTSHVLGEIEKIANRVAILLDGRLLAVHALTAGPGRRLRLRVRGDGARVAAALAAAPGVAETTLLASDSYRIELAPGAAAEDVAAALVRAGLGLVELREEPIDLEALFLALTAGRAPQEL
jgi:gliding motility-associated transport system ATP-binding protein